MDTDEGGMHIDPSSISLFSASEPSTSASALAATQPSSSMESTAIAPTAAPALTDLAKKDDVVQAAINYTKYAANRKSFEVTQRRQFVERLEKVKKAQGLNFTVPQFHQATTNQLATFLRKLRRSAESRTLISGPMLDKVFAGEGPTAGGMASTLKQILEGNKPTDAKKHNQIDEMFGNKRSGETVMGAPQIPRGHPNDENETTEEELSEDECADGFTPSAELYDLLEQRNQLLTADKHAKALLADVQKRRKMLEYLLAQMEKEPIGEFEEADEPNDETSARCRAFTSVKRRELVEHDFESNRDRSLRPLISNKRCGTEEYSFADLSIHPKLSMPSAIPLDAQIQKYLHAISVVPVEVETRRHKTAKLLSLVTTGNKQQQQQPPPPMHRFYNLADTTEDKFHSPEGTKSMKLSLLRKTLQKGFSVMERHGEEEGDEDNGDDDYVPSALQQLAKKRRRMTMGDQPVKKYSTNNSSSTKPSKLESRRASHHIEFGASMYDYDAQLMDIGLPLPAIQKVESVEIAIPSFRRKSGLAAIAGECKNCGGNGGEQQEDIWLDIKRAHGDLELQERRLRFRPPTGSGASSRKATMAGNGGEQKQVREENVGKE